MFDYPERKSYVYVIPTTKGDFVMRFKQATAQETMDFYRMMSNLHNWTFEEKVEIIRKINKYYNKLLKESSWYKWYKLWLRRKLRLVKKNLAKYIDQVVDLMHPLWDSIYAWTKKPKINGKNLRNSLFTNDREAIYQKTGIPTDKIYDKLTMEQIGWYIDKIVFENYELFKEWKAINDRITMKKWLSEEDKKDLDFIKSQSKKYGNGN